MRQEGAHEGDQRMRVSTSTPARRKASASRDHRVADIIGVLLLTLAVITLLSLFMANTGIIGPALSGFFRVLFGHAAWAVPLVIAFLGISSLRGQKVSALRPVTLGLSLVFLALVGALARSNGGDYFDVDAASASGGYVGAAIGWVFGSLLGAAKVVGLGALGCVGAILCLNTPLHGLAAAWTSRRRPTPREVGNTRRLPTHAVTRGGQLDAATEALPADEPTTRKVRWRGGDQAQEPALSREASVPKEGYQLPPLTLLAEPVAKSNQRSKAEMEQNIETLEGTLEQFGIEANVVEVATGPTVTRYEIQLGPGVRVARITALADNIAMDLAASHVRVEAPIPGKAAIGVEVPNSAPTPVFLRELCEAKEFRDSPSRLLVTLGKDVSGVSKYTDLTKMPHLLIGGATNSGKSIALTAVITSLLMRNTPKDLRLVMIDPKRVELTLFDRIPHLMCPVITDVKDAPGVLRAVWREMDRRYDVFNASGVRNIDGYNAKATFQERMSYIVVIIDELADLMIQAAAEVETSICRLAQLARATGIHLVIATQRPSVDVITGTIKANIPSRIAFTVSSHIDSRTIIDSKGAESLIGRGDMLFLPIDASKPTRIQGCYVSEAEIEAVCKFWREQEPPAYTLEPLEEVADPRKEGGDFGEQSDPLWEDAVRWAVDRGQASTSMLQRKFSIGFQRASRLLDEMEARQIVGPRDGPRPRDVLVSPMELDEIFGRRTPGEPAASKWD
ncbi:MAG: FtsK/SpoIIIE family DNA translocase [Fimbriimonadaceae bacterium]